MSDAVGEARAHLSLWGDKTMRGEDIAVVRSLIAEVERLRERLEMDFAWQFIKGVKTKVKVEPGSIPDGIDCRNETIKLQDDHIARLKADKYGAYEERNKLVALLASMYPSGIARTDIPGWLPEWHGCVYIDLPTGQASWHYHDGQAHLFEHLPPYTKPWDGHTTQQKYDRVHALSKDPR